MTLQRITVVGAAALAVSVLGFLLYMSRERPVDDALRDAQVGALRAVAQQETEFSELVARSRLSPDVEPSVLLATRARLAKSRLALLEGPTAVVGAGAATQAALETYSDLAKSQTRLAGEHEIDLRLFMASFRGLRRDADAALGSLSGASATSLRASVTALAGEAATYGLQATPDNGARIEDLLADITEGAREVEEEPRAALTRMAETVKGLRTHKDALQSRTGQLLALPLSAAIESVESAYLDSLQARQGAALRYRQILPVYTVALLAAFALIGFRLRSSFSQLDRANNELRDTNLNLEKLVDSRTQDLRKALEDLRLQQAQLVQSEKMASLGQMVAGVAHEINTPLGYARSNLETVRETLTAVGEGAALDAQTLGEFSALLADSEFGLSQIGELVMTLKDFSRVDRSLNEPFDLNECLETALKICHNQLKGRIQIERDYTELPQIPCAPSQLNQVFLNIITNGAQAIKGSGHIRVRTTDAGERVCASIRDSGCGMDEETRAHIFEPFFTTKDVGQGTGLGLSIVFSIVESHGGRIEVESAPGKGTEFHIFLPKQIAARRRSGGAGASSGAAPQALPA